MKTTVKLLILVLIVALLLIPVQAKTLTVAMIPKSLDYHFQVLSIPD